MPHKVFFSWQADRPTKEGRNLVERALERAIGRIGGDTTVEEAIRDLEIDRDTKGIPGSPPIVETIFRKIDAASVFVPDLTFIGTRPDGRPTPNPNVLIEYGWALKSLGHGKIVPVMNTAFGEPTPEAMPFDMRHLRNPIQYNCPVDADEDMRRLVRDGLVKELERRVRDVLLSDGAKIQANQFIPFVPREPSVGHGRFRRDNEPLGVVEAYYSNPKEVILTNDPAAWLRLMPTKDPDRTWQIGDLRRLATQNDGFIRPLFQGWSGLDFLRATDGFGIFPPSTKTDTTTQSVVFAFKTGEVWSVDTHILNAAKQGGSNLIPPVENDFRTSLKNYSDFLLRLGIEPPFKWIAGMEDLRGRGLFDSTGRMAGFRGPRGRCLQEEIIEEGLHHPDEPPEKSIEPFWIKVFDSCGVERPPLSAK